MKGCVLAEQMHVVNILPPVDADAAAANSDVFSMKNHGHVSIIIQGGVSAGAVPTVTVEACDDFVPTNTTAIAFNVYKEETTAGDTLGARTAVASTGMAMSQNNNIMYVIEIDAAELPDGKPNLRVCFTDPGAADLISAVAILSGCRFVGEQSETAIA